jgi:hypothetical protein
MTGRQEAAITNLIILAGACSLSRPDSVTLGGGHSCPGGLETVRTDLAYAERLLLCTFGGQYDLLVLLALVIYGYWLEESVYLSAFSCFFFSSCAIGCPLFDDSSLGRQTLLRPTT